MESEGKPERRFKMNSLHKQTGARSRPGSRQSPLMRRLAPVGKPYRVLLAHSHLPLRDLLAATLRKDDFRVTAVDNGVEVLDWLADSILGYPERDSPDLIVVELELPGRKGIDLLADLRYAGVAVPFILISDRHHEAAVQCARNLRGTAVFDGPFDADDFRTAAFVLTRWYRKEGSHGKSLIGLP